jgi:hypothetical protein
MLLPLRKIFLFVALVTARTNGKVDKFMRKISSLLFTPYQIAINLPIEFLPVYNYIWINYRSFYNMLWYPVLRTEALNVAQVQS